MEPAEVVRIARDAGVHLVSFFWCDNSGIIRGKSTHISGLEGRLNSGIGVAYAMQAMGDMDQLQAVEGMGPAGEFRLMPDTETFAILPYAPKRALMLSDLMTMSREPWEACPRDFLKRMLARGESMGIKFRVAMEPEWYLARREGDDFLPCEESLDNSSVGMTFAQDVVDDIIEALESQGIGIEQYHTEVGHSQHELSIRHAPALRAADNHLIYRETVRNVAYQHGMYATFAPKPFPDQAGNGNHIHFSAWDADERTNLFYDAEDEQSLSELAYYFIGGVMEHLSALVALTCPSMNSYRRLSPGSWSTAYTCYGPDNREAALRIPSNFWGAEMASTNLEFRPSDSSANPYIALGGLIAAGLDGIEREILPSEGQRVDVDPTDLTEQELTERGILRLPATLKEATQELEQDSLLMEAMGDMLARSYLAIRRADWDIFSGESDEFEIRNHFYKY